MVSEEAVRLTFMAIPGNRVVEPTVRWSDEWPAKPLLESDDMAKKTKIHWCDSTVNPTGGCDGCELQGNGVAKCYAGGITQRFGASNPGLPNSFGELMTFPGRMAEAARWLDLTGIQGGESGTEAKPFDLRWAEKLLSQCHRLGVPYFFKQIGSRPVRADTPIMLLTWSGSDWSELPTRLRVRQMPAPRDGRRKQAQADGMPRPRADEKAKGGRK